MYSNDAGPLLMPDEAPHGLYSQPMAASELSAEDPDGGQSMNSIVGLDVSPNIIGSQPPAGGKQLVPAEK